MVRNSCFTVGLYISAYMCYRQLPRVKSDSDTRKSRRSSHAVSDQNGSGSPLLGKRPLVEEETVSARKVSQQKLALESAQSEGASDSPMSYLEKRRAERA